MKKLITTTIITLFVLLFTNIHAQVTTTLNPVADAHVYTFGGGQGGNSFLKFDISSIPLGGEILSATLDVYVKSIKIWDGDVNFFNVNNQTWTEAEVATDLYGYTRSDSTHQALGFGTSIGWTSSVDLKNIVSKDYILSNQYCTVFMKDPDDLTFVPGVPLNNLDSLVVGNVSFGQGISFGSRESPDPNLKPKLIVTYSVATGGLNENSLSNMIHVFPNPGNGVVILSVNKPLNNASFKLLTISGQVVMQKTNLFGSVLSFDITGQANGIYFIEVNQNGNISRMKLVKH